MTCFWECVMREWAIGNACIPVASHVARVRTAPRNTSEHTSLSVKGNSWRTDSRDDLGLLETGTWHLPSHDTSPHSYFTWHESHDTDQWSYTITWHHYSLHQRMRSLISGTQPRYNVTTGNNPRGTPRWYYPRGTTPGQPQVTTPGYNQSIQPQGYNPSVS